MNLFLLFNRMLVLISINCRVKMYDMIDINEMAYAVYNATINPKQRKDVEKSYGKALSQQWHKLNELCMDLKKYYKMKKSSRKEILTTLDKFYGYDIPMHLDFLDIVDEDKSTNQKEEETGQATQSCETPQVSSNTTTYDMDWLYSFDIFSLFIEQLFVLII